MLVRSLTRIPSHEPDTGLVHAIIDTPLGRCRLRRHHSPIAFASRRIRLAAVGFLTTALSLLDFPQ